MVIIIDPKEATTIQQFLQQQGETVYQIGTVQARQGNEHQTRIN